MYVMGASVPRPDDVTRHNDGVAYADDPEGYMQQLEAKLQPQRIRATLGFAGPFTKSHTR
jgi:hypothetical protein